MVEKITKHYTFVTTLQTYEMMPSILIFRELPRVGVSRLPGRSARNRRREMSQHATWQCEAYDAEGTSHDVQRVSEVVAMLHCHIMVVVNLC